MFYDIAQLINWISRDFEPRVRVGPQAGAYARRAEESHTHLYGTCDMACVYHTIGQLPQDDAARGQWVDILQSLQDPQTGYLVADPADHGMMHNTAFALGALNLFDAQPRHPLHFFRQYDSLDMLRKFFDGLDWREHVYSCSHDGAGLASAAALVPGTVTSDWFDAYFDYLDARFDPANGMLGIDKPAAGDFDQIGGTFHYAFLYEYFGRTMPFAEARTDAILGLQLPSGNWHERNVWWLTLDAIYMLDRDQRRIGHRPAEVREAIIRALAAAAARLENPEVLQALTPHALTAVVSLITIAQQHLGPDEVRSPQPLKLVLDRRPFI